MKSTIFFASSLFILMIMCLSSVNANTPKPTPTPTANKILVPNKLPPKPQPLPEWKYAFARTAVSALDTINGATTNQTIRDPHISASIKGGQPVFHIFYHPKYNANTPWKWNIKQINKLNEVVDFLSYKNAFKDEPLHNQAKVVMVSIGNQNTFYIFYVTNDEAKSFAKDSWQAFFTNTPENVLAGINQGSVLNDLEVSGTDKGFYYFFKSDKSGVSGDWGWARVETPEGALKYLNTKYVNKPVEHARIAAVQEPTQVVFYVFYR